MERYSGLQFKRPFQLDLSGRGRIGGFFALLSLVGYLAGRGEQAGSTHCVPITLSSVRAAKWYAFSCSTC